LEDAGLKPFHISLTAIRSESWCGVNAEVAQDCTGIFCACEARLEEHSGLCDSSRNKAGAKKDKQDASVQG